MTTMLHKNTHRKTHIFPSIIIWSFFVENMESTRMAKIKNHISGFNNHMIQIFLIKSILDK